MSTGNAASNIPPSTMNLSEHRAFLTYPNMSDYQARLEGFSGESSHLCYVAEVAGSSNPNRTVLGYNSFDYFSSDLSAILNFGTDDLYDDQGAVKSMLDAAKPLHCYTMLNWGEIIYPVGVHNLFKVNETGFQNCFKRPLSEALTSSKDMIVLATPGKNGTFMVLVNIVYLGVKN
ncbi:hypothetical protein LguiA_014251 [Lonicera macranthoides]